MKWVKGTCLLEVQAGSLHPLPPSHPLNIRVLLRELSQRKIKRKSYQQRAARNDLLAELMLLLGNVKKPAPDTFI